MALDSDSTDIDGKAAESVEQDQTARKGVIRVNFTQRSGGSISRLHI